MKINCICVDDEPLALNILENYIQRVDFLEHLGSFRNALEAFNFISQNKVDLLFLDIQMPQISGFDFLKTLQNKPKIIFTTAHREYAVESYEWNALDYLLKPIAFERFLNASHKMLLSQNINLKPVKPPSEESHNFIYLKAQNKVFKIALENILYAESFKDYIQVYQTESAAISSYQSLSHFEKSLPTQGFLRIHRSYLIATAHIESFNANTISVSAKELPIGRTYKEQVHRFLGIQ